MARDFIKKQGWKLLIMTMLSVSIALIFLLVSSVTQIQGNARVINYAGIVRGATQRLVKLEMAGHPDDNLITQLDQILYELQNGGKEYNLTVLQDSDYQTKLLALAEEWVLLKEDIYNMRKADADHSTILERSEKYFFMADETVTAAEHYSDGLAAKLSNIKFILISDIIIIIFVLCVQIFLALRLSRINRELKSNANFDKHTKLPNKDYCEIILSSHDYLPSTEIFACIMFDLNNLKTINDSMGHQTGDLLIFNFATLLRDAFPQDVFVGRYGGDEFIAVLEKHTKEQIEEYLDNLKKKAAARKSIDHFEIKFSYGYEISTDSSAKNLHELLILADEKMYINKRELKRTL